MFNILFIVLGLLVAIILIVLVLASMKPDNFRIARSIAVNAPPEKIYALIEDFHRWTEWSPWEKLDPELKRTYRGAAHGNGAIYEWDSKTSKAGAGRMTITGTQPPNKVTLLLEFLRPFQATNSAVFTMEPQGSTTNVSWSMTGSSPFMVKIMHVFMNMDAMVGKDFDAGLTAIKAIAER